MRLVGQDILTKRSSVSLPEWSKGLRSGRNGFERVGSNPTAATDHCTSVSYSLLLWVSSWLVYGLLDVALKRNSVAGRKCSVIESQVKSVTC
ncbi:hypothetical protein PsorP6_019013 [Peronosclerospora sorghi]|nr:hypothetical protein PsorP6_018999 [Peronosclerospora sorghi]KAI9895136.1 hypothetical protein PsorP6_019013 [Peronosclerospora sorghi]